MVKFAALPKDRYCMCEGMLRQHRQKNKRRFIRVVDLSALRHKVRFPPFVAELIAQT
ncbi:hypothetical protein OAN307_c19930 [Octadecabacter antarcticus 307]|uniref:Uncharacterized protein n=1 Tax=Octadecabacter antarcticus 307 TaxID=391626 RepID=M9R4T3_9RHOB|nr:hypothetical protein OAN307_c19930 [Octadecabacter antarcticus 307]